MYILGCRWLFWSGWSLRSESEREIERNGQKDIRGPELERWRHWRKCVLVDGELDERRQRAGVALSQRHLSKRQWKTFTVLCPERGKWCWGIIRVCLCEIQAFVSPLFCLRQPIFLNFLLFFWPLPLSSSSSSLSLCIMWCFHCGSNSANRC